MDAPIAKNDKFLRMDRRRRAAELYLQGLTQYQIALKLNVSQMQISRDIAIVHKEWLRSAESDIAILRIRELQRIDHLESTFWRSFEKTILTYVDQNGEVQTTAGDVKILDGVKWCVERRCKMLGLDALTTNVNIDLANLTDEQLERLAKGDSVYSILAVTKPSEG